MAAKYFLNNCRSKKGVCVCVHETPMKVRKYILIKTSVSTQLAATKIALLLKGCLAAGECKHYQKLSENRSVSERKSIIRALSAISSSFSKQLPIEWIRIHCVEAFHP